MGTRRLAAIETLLAQHASNGQKIYATNEVGGDAVIRAMADLVLFQNAAAMNAISPAGALGWFRKADKGLLELGAEIDKQDHTQYLLTKAWAKSMAESAVSVALGLLPMVKEVRSLILAGQMASLQTELQTVRAATAAACDAGVPMSEAAAVDAVQEVATAGRGATNALAAYEGGVAGRSQVVAQFMNDPRAHMTTFQSGLGAKSAIWQMPRTGVVEGAAERALVDGGGVLRTPGTTMNFIQNSEASLTFSAAIEGERGTLGTALGEVEALIQRQTGQTLAPQFFGVGKGVFFPGSKTSQYVSVSLLKDGAFDVVSVSVQAKEAPGLVEALIELLAKIN
jgi:hypothetical protein